MTDKQQAWMSIFRYKLKKVTDAVEKAQYYSDRKERLEKKGRDVEKTERYLSFCLERVKSYQIDLEQYIIFKPYPKDCETVTALLEEREFVAENLASVLEVLKRLTLPGEAIKATTQLMAFEEKVRESKNARKSN